MYFDLRTGSISQGGRSSKWSKTIDKIFNKKLDDFLRREDWAKIEERIEQKYGSISLILFSFQLFKFYFLFSFYLFYFIFRLFCFFYLFIFLVCFNCLFCVLNKFVVFVSLLVLGFELSFLNKFSVLICLLSSLFFSNKKELEY